MKNKTIYLIGLPGAGKSTVGKHLSKQLNMDFVDLDHEIEKNAHMFIEEIFTKHDEATFRKWEHETLKSIANKNVVVACGGGIVTYPLNYEVMKEGHIIHLMADHDVLTKRLENSYKRPILSTKSMAQLYEERFMSYQKFADVHMDAEREIDGIIQSILNYLKEDIQ